MHACDSSTLEAEAGECYFQATCYLMELLVLFLIEFSDSFCSIFLLFQSYLLKLFKFFLNLCVWEFWLHISVHHILAVPTEVR